MSWNDWPHVRGTGGQVPWNTQIFTGTRQDALLQAIEANTKDNLPLTANERTNAAWRLVREFEEGLSKAQIAKATGVAARTVATMRSRWKQIRGTEMEITGQWWRDRMDREVTDSEHQFLTDSKRKAEIKRMKEEFQKAAGYYPKVELELVADALQEAFGFKLKNMAEYLFASDGEHYDYPIKQHSEIEDPDADF